MNFPLDFVEDENLILEEFHRKGREDGMRKAETSCILEGYRLGVEFSSSYAAIVHFILTIDASLLSESRVPRSIKILQTLQEMLHAFDPNNTEEAAELFEKIISKYKLLKAQLERL